MTKDEALKLALEVLGNIKNDPFKFDLKNDIEEAITAIKEALANEALEKMAENARELGLDYEPEQEPVTCVEYIPCCTDQTCSKCKAATPPQRTWVGLTRMELIKCGVLPYGMSYELYEAIEAKLRSKNT